MYLPELYANATWRGLWTDLSLENQNDTGLPMMNSPAWPLGEQSKGGVRCTDANIYVNWYSK